MAYFGTHFPRLDEKGRLFLPAKFRDAFSEGLVITKSQERCLFVFSRTDFDNVTAALGNSSLGQKAKRDFTRVFFSGATEEVPDKQGRISLPQALRDYAGLERDCAVVGAHDRVEIWDAETWQRYLESQQENFAELSEEVLGQLI